MAIAPAASPIMQLAAHIDALKKHELAFLNLHKELVEEIIFTGRKYSKFTPGTILREKGIRYYSAVMRKRVDYERRNENAYRRARAAVLVTLRRIGARQQAMYLFQRWSAIEKILPKLEAAIVEPWTWARGSRGSENVYKAAEQLYELQRQIVEFLGKIETQLLSAAGSRR